jgi:hypothetical protein
MTSPLINLGDSGDGGGDSTNTSADFSVRSSPQSSDLIDPASYPFDLPRWFVCERCVASSPGRWLVRGRDSKRGIALALKVIELPTHLTESEHDKILDACELAAKVRNRVWIVPDVAAIRNRRLAVIRPWVFAHPWHQPSINDRPGSRRYEAELRSLASVAFAVQAAHKVGATHGGIHLENLLVDHQGNAKIVDAICSRRSIARWLHCSPSDSPGGQSCHQKRMNLDVQDLIKVIVASSLEWTDNSTNQLTTDLRSIADDHPGEACGLIGELLIRRADTLDRPPTETTQRETGTMASHHRRWLARLHGWVSGS